jgi:hypothetical protein
MGRETEADELRTRTVDVLRLVLGEDHPLMADARADRRIDGELEFQPL